MKLLRIFSLKKAIIVILALCILYLILINIPASSTSAQKEFQVFAQESISSIASRLEQEKLILNKYLFISYLFLTGKANQIKAGVYDLNSKMSTKTIANILIEGKEKLIKITIPEGWNLRDIGFYLESLGLFQAEEFWKVAGFPATDYSKTTDLPRPLDFSDKFPFLKEKPKEVGLEGYLFPDTYFVPKTITPEKLIELFLSNFQNKVYLSLQNQLKKSDKSLFEILTMASLLEKEVKSMEDKRIVSGILWKRLKVGMPLQVDATITYLTNKKTTKIGGEVLEIDSKYNTYKYKGLPLGPICNPGIESILAALNPQESPYWYYLTTPDGVTIFSKTYQEHLLAKKKYLK